MVSFYSKRDMAEEKENEKASWQSPSSSLQVTQKEGRSHLNLVPLGSQHETHQSPVELEPNQFSFCNQEERMPNQEERMYIQAKRTFRVSQMLKSMVCRQEQYPG
jgi:hypothetical protein